MPASSLGSIFDAIGFKKVRSSFSIPEFMIFSQRLWNISCSVAPVSSEIPWLLVMRLSSLTISPANWLLLADFSSSRLYALSSLFSALYCSSKASSICRIPPTAPPIPICVPAPSYPNSSHFYNRRSSSLRLLRRSCFTYTRRIWTRKLLN